MVDVGSPVRNDRIATSGDDWPAQAADTIERVVQTVRDKTTGPALTISRMVVYGMFAAIVGMAALVLVLILVVRLVNNYLPESVFGETHVWAAHLITGSALTLVGLILWSRRRARPEDSGAR